MAAKKTQDQAPKMATETTPDWETLRAVTSDTATTPEDVALLAYKGDPIPSGWSYNPRTGFVKGDVQVDPLRPVDNVGPNVQGADAPSTPDSGDGA